MNGCNIVMGSTRRENGGPAEDTIDTKEHGETTAPPWGYLDVRSHWEKVHHLLCESEFATGNDVGYVNDRRKGTKPRPGTFDG